jgi:hypothetical protein
MRRDNRPLSRNLRNFGHNLGRTLGICWKPFAILNLTARFCYDTFFPDPLPQRG